MKIDVSDISAMPSNATSSNRRGDYVADVSALSERAAHNLYAHYLFSAGIVGDLKIRL